MDFFLRRILFMYGVSHMIISIDTETKGLEATNEAFIMGCICYENMTTEVIYNREQMWDRILEIGEKVAKNKGVLNVYAHNMGGYDYWVISDRTNKNMHYLSDQPFIATYRKGKKDMVKFLDTYSLYKMSLKKIGEIIGMEKGETPETLKTGKKVKITQEMEEYMIQDAQICMKAIQYLKNKLEKEGIRLKRLYTINQIAIQYMLHKLKLSPKPYLFHNEDRNQMIFTKTPLNLHEAYRGGRVEAFKTGYHEKVTYIDVNSLYPQSSMEITFPDLRTQQLIYYPLNVYTQKDLLNQQGIARTLIKNETDDIGLLPIRTPEYAYYPKMNSTIMGTWTLNELRKAVTCGYKIIAIQWALLYEQAPENPYTTLIPEIYKKRLTNNQFNKYFYKSIMNNHLGKFGQTRIGQEIIIDNVETTEQYLKQGYKAVQGIKGTYDYMFKKTNTKQKNKPYYCPWIPTLVNAQARIKMHTDMHKIGKKDLIYTAMDSLMFTGKHLNKFKISNKMGEYKTEHKDEKVLIYGRNTYQIGSTIKASGIHRKDLNIKDFQKGYADTKQIIKLKSATATKDIGTFKSEHRDFKSQLNNYNKTMELLEATEFFKDYNIRDISYFLPFLNQNI